MKKIVSVLLVALIALSLTACFTLKEDTAEYYGLNELVTVKKLEIKAMEIRTSEGEKDEILILNPIIPGSEYVGVKISIINKGTESFSCSSILCFSAQVDKKDVSMEIYAAQLFDGENLDGNIEPNDTMLAWYCFKAPTEWQEIKLTFKPDLLSSAKVAFKLTSTQAV